MSGFAEAAGYIYQAGIWKNGNFAPLTKHKTLESAVEAANRHVGGYGQACVKKPNGAVIWCDFRDFAAIDIMSLATGILMRQGGFAEYHRAIEAAAGRPVWTHEFPELGPKLMAPVQAQHPWVAEFLPVPEDRAERWAWMKRVEAALDGKRYSVMPVKVSP